MLDNFHQFTIGLDQRIKKFLLLLMDVVALTLALWSSYALRFSEFWPQPYIGFAKPLFLVTPIMGVAILIKLGLYRAVLRYMNIHALSAVLKGVLIISATLYLQGIIFDVAVLPRSIPIIFAFVALSYIGGSRIFIRTYHQWLLSRYIEKAPVLIYGAGEAGVKLSKMLAGESKYLPVGFLDDHTLIHGKTTAGLEVFAPERAAELIEKLNIEYILIALPTLSDKERKVILDRVTNLPVKIKTIPTINDIIDGESINQLRDIQIEDLLGRDVVEPIPELVAASIKNKTILVTGAGGSIGSELCRQAIRHGANHIVLFELSEYNLFAIDKELNEYKSKQSLTTTITPILGNVIESDHIVEAIKNTQPHTIYHAAAYKHVTLVQQNPVIGFKNNTVGTYNTVKAAVEHNVERFVLISTDKAAKPSNFMGASKRLSEIIVSNFTKKSSTKLATVRFGNVLGSSGSVIPIFKKQIAEGGPVTVTDPEVTRYFMTIPEAALLVIQAGSLTNDHDMFILDMGQPVKIRELAEKMIHLSTRENSDKAIEIIYTGLKPGEKLHEILSISMNHDATAHPKIQRVAESIKTTKISFRKLQSVSSTEEVKQFLMDYIAELELDS